MYDHNKYSNVKDNLKGHNEFEVEIHFYEAHNFNLFILKYGEADTCNKIEPINFISLYVMHSMNG